MRSIWVGSDSHRQISKTFAIIRREGEGKLLFTRKRNAGARCEARKKEQLDEKFNDGINKGKIEQNEKRNNWRRRLGKPDTSAKVYQLKAIHCFVLCNPISSRQSYAGLRSSVGYGGFIILCDIFTENLLEELFLS